MFNFNGKANSVGVAYKVEDLERKIVQYADAWKTHSNRKSFWRSSKFSKATAFILYVLDDFILTVMEVAISGPDKKATVIDAVGRLYDFMAAEALPIWLRPVAIPIRQYVVYVLLNVAIDWIVSKYKNAGWRRPEKKAWDGKYVPCRREM